MTINASATRRSAPRLGSLPAWATATPLRRAFLVTAGWRSVIGIWGIVAHALARPGPYAGDTLMRRGWPANPLTFLIDAGVRMDGFWYARIAQHGYFYSLRRLSSIVYFPLYPVLIKGAGFITGDVYVAGLLISSVSLFLAVWMLQLWLDHRSLGAASAMVTGLMLTFPVGFFWASMYAESLFLFLVLATFVLYERERWVAAAAMAFLAALCRPTGLILVPVLAVMAAAHVRNRRFDCAAGQRSLVTEPPTPAGVVAGVSADGCGDRQSAGLVTGFPARPPGEAVGSVGWAGARAHTDLGSPPGGLGQPGNADPGAAAIAPGPRLEDGIPPRRFAVRPWLAVVAPIAGYASFALYQWVAFGTPLASVRAERVPPFARGLSRALSDLTLRRPGFPSWYLAALLAFGVLFLAAVPVVYRRFGAAYALFGLLAVVFPATSGLISLERYVMIDFPVFAAVALTGKRSVPIAIMTVGFYLSLGLMALFVAGYTVI